MSETERDKHIRRQTVLGVVVMVLSVFVLAQAYYSFHQDRAQRACLASQVSELTDSIQYRGELAQRDTMAQNALITAVFKSESPEQVQTAYAAFVKEEADIAHDRSANPTPDFPKGTCGGSD